LAPCKLGVVAAVRFAFDDYDQCVALVADGPEHFAVAFGPRGGDVARGRGAVLEPYGVDRGGGEREHDDDAPAGDD
jgi:hypothetical protein